MALTYLSLSQLTGCSPGTRWIVGLYERKQRVLAVSPPSVVFVGGSAAHFGISANELRDRGVSAVNFGSHAGLGLPFLLDRAIATARTGDTLVLMLEYDHFRYAGQPDEALFEYSVCLGGDVFSEFPLVDLARRLFTASPKQLVMNVFFNKDANRRYQLHTVGAFGDEMGNTEASRRDVDLEFVRSQGALRLPEAPSAEATIAIEAFLREATRKGVAVAATWPSVRASAFPVDGRAVRMLEEFWAQHRVPVLGCVEDSLLPDSSLFDTIYHPTSHGARARSSRLAPNLTALLSGDRSGAACSRGASR